MTRGLSPVHKFLLTLTLGSQRTTLQKKNSSRFVIGTRGLHSTDQQEHAAAPKRPF
jgi:hypothetical protein